MESSQKIYTIVLAWNHLNDTLECIDSLERSIGVNLQILLVDNGSVDGTDRLVPQKFPDVEVIRIPNNIGIARGYNAGIERALDLDADHVMVINNDTVVASDMIQILVQTMELHPNAGMTVPKIYYYDNRERLWSAGAGWYWFPPRIKLIGLDKLDGPKYQELTQLQYATSCCILINRKVLETVGTFDPYYYFYFDDWDLSERVRHAGFEILLVPDAHLWHKVSVTTTKDENPRQYWFTLGKSSVRFYIMHKSLLWLAGYSIWFIVREIMKMKFGRIPPFISGVNSGLQDYFNT